ncbi:LysR family transcriptional regulator [Hydrogenophaga sp. OTU3427]|uniref:LysR family transcriptional regulator n=1 Tax=Hydrogenophaga sp. OTU3427 TaxID=3043856 RepID=UPI00313D7AE8
MQHLDFRTLRQFVAVAENESISKAATVLHISASPLSRAILKLESQIGFPLFERIGRGLRLNNAGRELLLNARRIIMNNEQLVQDLQRRASGMGGTVVIGHMPGALYNGVIPSTARSVQQAHPSLRFQFESAPEDEQLVALRHGHLDFAVSTQEVADADVRAETYSVEKYVLLLPRHHPCAEIPRITLKQLMEAEWVVTPVRPGQSLRTRFTAACNRLGFDPRVACVAGDMISALALVAGGFGLCVAQESLMQFVGHDIVVRALPLLKMESQYRIVWRPDALAPGASRFLDALLVNNTKT